MYHICKIDLKTHNHLHKRFIFQSTSDVILYKSSHKHVVNRKQILKSKIQSIRKKIEEVKSEIQKVKEDKIYKVIEENDDLEEYFNEMKEKLEVERDELEEKLGNILS